MTLPDRPDQEPEAPSEGVSEPAPKTRRWLSRVRRELSDEELANPAVVRLLVSELDRLDVDLAELKPFRDQFHTADKEVAVLKAKLARSFAWEVISTACLAVGAAALGYAPNLWTAQPAGWMALVFGGILVIGGVVALILR